MTDTLKLSVLGHLERAVLNPGPFRVLTLEVHVIQGGCQQILEMRGVLCDLLLILLLRDQIYGPTLVHFGDQVHALGVVDTVLLPALDQLVLELLCLL